MQKETIIISLGGSLVAPDVIDTAFLKAFKKAVLKHAKKFQFLIFVGGGKTARMYQTALGAFGGSDAEKDLMGIRLSRANAKLVRQVFSKEASQEIIVNPTKKVGTTKNISIGAGYKPGFSTDYVSVLAAKTYGVKTVINLTNVDYVYDKNPKKFPPASSMSKALRAGKNAKPLKEISWKDFRKIVGNKWTPGLNMPFDPRASQLAEKLKLKVVVIHGKNTKSLENFLKGKLFIGTTIT